MTPLLSIIAAHAYPQDNLARFLASVPSGVEVVLCDGVGIREPSAGDSAIRYCRAVGCSAGALRGIGVRNASADLLALVDLDCRLGKGWLTAALGALKSTPAACGPVLYDGGCSLPAWAAFLAEYGAFLPPSSEHAGVAGTNFVIRRDVLNQVWDGRGPLWKDAIVDRLRAAGLAPRYVPGMQVAHRRPWTAVAFFRDRLKQGRCYAGRRRENLLPARRLLHALAIPVVGAVLQARLLRGTAGKPRYRGGVIRAAAMTYLNFCAWAAGEAIGYLHGPGPDCDTGE